MPVAAANAADAMAQVHAVHAASSRHRAMVHGEYYGVALAQRHDLGARLHARPLLGDDELAAREIRSWLGKKNGDLEREDVLAVEILVQAVVIPRLVLKKQRGGPRLACLGTAGKKLGVLERITHSDTEGLIPTVRNRGEPRVEGGPKLAHRLRQRVGEIPVFPASEAMPAHHHTASETVVLRIERRKIAALFRFQQALDQGTALAVELTGQPGPVERGDPIVAVAY